MSHPQQNTTNPLVSSPPSPSSSSDSSSPPPSPTTSSGFAICRARCDELWSRWHPVRWAWEDGFGCAAALLPNDSAVVLDHDPVASFLDRAQWLRPRLLGVALQDDEHPVRALGVAWVLRVQCAVAPLGGSESDAGEVREIVLELAGNDSLPPVLLSGPWPAPDTLPSLDAVQVIFNLGPYLGRPTKGLSAGPRVPPDAHVVDWEAHVDVLLQRRVYTPPAQSPMDRRNDGRATTTSLLDDEFRFIASTSRTFHSSGDFGAASAPWNVHKNRYVDVMAPDATRVQLVQSGRSANDGPEVPEENRISLRASSSEVGAADEPDRDYINASYISGGAGPRTYIATQGPKGDTLVDFWRLVWQQRVKVIVMLTRCQERGVNKCAQYWPVLGTCVQMGSYVITHVQENRLPVTDDGTKPTSVAGAVWRREFRMDHHVRTPGSDATCTESRLIVQLQYTQWPDKGMPATVGAFYDVVTAVEAEAGDASSPRGCSDSSTSCKPPVLVHCSAGIGRSGTFIVVHSLLDSLLRDLASAKDGGMPPLAGSVVSEVLRIRRQRPGLVQTREQLLFCYLALAYCLDSRLSGADSAARRERDERFAMLAARVHATRSSNMSSSTAASRAGAAQGAAKAKLREVLDRRVQLSTSDERGSNRWANAESKRPRLDARDVSSSGESSATTAYTTAAGSTHTAICCAEQARAYLVGTVKQWEGDCS
eukprot:CAMPEP_0170733758 /NCGR_PEP_ID=MMETSP0437-20130122/2238_1 /TAXON_ID=0 /ORGANISM="Sexangularia sp." /LENGTH=707 /DNA_ID=CAMNT_0011072047 /DNA_START=104 /DNA_END=2225 /DNA_ORIENTATION=-